ncbi:trna methyltransferase [Ophiostoma piceae UAMH 11346]|uniref:Trna methyltransferase n=1 Tax=Ophiostoma piceae (strain UAMH 11346) TaxID=1262450 RepID=S3C3K6_OPHP1|nr:trna methyltransferase [Ophiostoma piceae UAMH 11346]
MAVPFHRLKVSGDILIAARGAGIHTFNATDGSYISSWQVPQKAEKPEKAQETKGHAKDSEKTEEAAKVEETEKGDVLPAAEGDDDAPPSKRRRVEGELMDELEKTEEAEAQGEKTQESAQKKKKKPRNKAPQVHKDPAKAQASALRTADLPVISILEVTADGRHVVAIMGQDKTVRVLAHENGHLTQLSESVVPKRPCAVDFTADGQTILSGDKFGDVYALPLIEVELTEEQKREEAEAKAKAEEELKKRQRELVVAPIRLEATEFTVHTKGNRQALENQRKQKELFAAQHEKLQKDKEEKNEYQLLLGHVSMLTAVVTAEGIIKGEGGKIKKRPLILTADRDEHIRVTRGIVGNSWGAGSQTHVIETFCLGHTSFVSKLCIPRDRPDRLVSGGGDGELWVWDFWPQGRLLGKADLASHVGAVQGAEKTKVALSGLYSFGKPADPDAMTDGESSAFVVAICERVPALFFFRMEDATLTHTQTLQLPEGQLPLDVVEAGGQLFVATVPAEQAAPEATEAPSTLLSVTKGALGGWAAAAAAASISLPAPTADTDAATASLDRTALRKLLLHSTESLRKDNEEEKEEEKETNE